MSKTRAQPPARSELDPIEVASRDEIQALQLQRLKWSIRHAYDHVAVYRAKCDQAGVHPGDLTSLSDLARFPFTVKDDLRASYPFKHFAVPMSDVVRIHASSGTTGKPTVMGYTAKDIDVWSEMMARSIRAAGGRRTDLIHVAYGYGLFTGGLGAHYGGERLGATVIPMSGGQTERQVQMIRDLEPGIIMVTPSYLLVIADEMERQGLDPRASSLRIGILGAEPWTETMRQEIEARLDLDAIDIYGLSEVMGPGVAQECLETKDGLHVWEDHFYPEIIDPTTGAVLAEGEPGELVFTSLSKEATPVIRYRTRDLTRLLPGTARSMRRMAKITGRSDDMLIIRGANVFPTQIEELILKDARLAPVYLIEVRRDRRLDEITVQVELKPGLNDESAPVNAAVDLTRAIRAYVGVSAEVRVMPENAIPRSAGKAKRVNDLRVKE